MNLNKHREYFDPEKIREAKVPIHIIGVGAIGSHIAIQLAKLGIEEITVWDFDTVDDHNITNQVYTFQDIGKPKVDAIERHMSESNPSITVHKRGKWNPGDIIEGIIFLEVDTMKVRQEFVEDNEYNAKLILVIDARIGLETGEVHVCNWQDQKELENYMKKVNSFSDDQAVVIKSACGTTLSVSPSVYLASGEAVAAFINYIKNGLYVNYIGYNAFSFKMNGRLM